MSRRNKSRSDKGWTTVETKKKRRTPTKWVTIEVPPEVIDGLFPLERSVYDVIVKAKSPLTSKEIVEAVADNCTVSDIGNVVYDGALREYLEADDWDAHPKKWRLRKIKVDLDV